jgi:hypothetical protein
MNPRQLRHLSQTLLLSGSLLTLNASAAPELIKAKDGSGVYGYKDTPKLPWCEWVVHDPDRPAPARVDPGPAGPIAPVPSDAVVLFDGKGLQAWTPAKDWVITNGVLVAGQGVLSSKQTFSSGHYHLEWMAPANFKGPWYDQGNNGVLLLGRFEIQIFDSYNEKLYPDGQCAAIYGQTPPLVNVTRKPGEWQTFDIIFTAPKFENDKLKEPARVTMFHNGVLVHLNEPVYGETGHRIAPEYRTKSSTGPIGLGAHGCPVAFRSVWVRPLNL